MKTVFVVGQRETEMNFVFNRRKRISDQ